MFQHLAVSTSVSYDTGETLTGATSGIVGKVINTQAATTTTAATLFIAYTKSGTNNTSASFTDGETLNGTNSAIIVMVKIAAPIIIQW